MNIDQNLITDLEKYREPQVLIKELFIRFGKRAAIGTSGQLTGSVLVDMACKTGIKPRVFTIDTLRLFPETTEFFKQIEKKYRIKIERIKPDPVKLKRMIAQHGEYLFFDTKEKQEYCCNLRKVEPNNKVLNTLDVWITGLRTDQSESRALTPRLQIIYHGDQRRPILKVAPLVDWEEAGVRAYLKKNKVPIHPLLKWKKDGWFYESLGCILCTTPIGPGEPRRAGRWRWFNAFAPDKKECGIHVDVVDQS